jgi:hypothetical protein
MIFKYKILLDWRIVSEILWISRLLLFCSVFCCYNSTTEQCKEKRFLFLAHGSGSWAAWPVAASAESFMLFNSWQKAQGLLSVLVKEAKHKRGSPLYVHPTLLGTNLVPESRNSPAWANWVLPLCLGGSVMAQTPLKGPTTS